MLRQPLEDQIVTISRSKAVFQFPANIMLAASLNPCPCGYHGHEYGDNRCTCSLVSIARYRAKISGPLLDRIDLHLEVPRPPAVLTPDSGDGLTSADMRLVVSRARARQEARNRELGIGAGVKLTGASLRRAIELQPKAAELLSSAFEALGISMRSYDRILRLARTIADIEESERVDSGHVAEALQYRRLDQAVFA